ncbi:hypothetical protein DFH28DRAFT_931179 [Melampsora americana]|nr:hypothetical protein DFH28DRAFT_931179 [Melampsora americana]
MEVAHMVLSKELDNSDLDIDIYKISKAINAMDYGMWEGEADKAIDEATLEAYLCHSQVANLSSWYPFKKKEELANPMISPHLVCLPQLPSKHEPVNSLAQSQKWREGFPNHQQVRMVASGQKHFYIYKRIQLFSQAIVVPVFFFTTMVVTKLNASQPLC